MTQNTFEKIRFLVKQIPSGFVSTYGNVAAAAGIKNPRVVGWAIYKNQNREIPCHRVVQKNGHLAPKFSLGGPQEQYRRLAIEGVKFVSPEIVDMDKCFYNLLSQNFHFY